jgi:hypothetical protein
MANKKARNKRIIPAGKIAGIIAKRLAKLSAAVRDAKLDEIHRIASTARRPPSEKALGHARIPESRLSARPREES